MVKKILLSVFIVVVLIGGTAFTYLKHPKFGPSLEAIHSQAVLNSPNYVDGAFQNQIPTPLFTEDVSFVSVLWENLTEKKPDGLRPDGDIPTVKTDLAALNRDEDLVIWLGHSSYYVQLGGKRMLIDPVFSTYAAPVAFANKVFDGANPYTVEDMPEIDVLLITHSHWDHLDYDTIKALEPKVGRAITALGVGSYLTYWGYPQDKVHDVDWNDAVDLGAGLSVHALPARHYTRRLMETAQTLWVAFAFISEDARLFFSGDSGYGPHFAEIGKRFGGFDLAALDSGQYNRKWAFIHMNPEEAAQAALDLDAKNLMPAHIGKFSISNHAWDEPFRRISAASVDKPYNLLTPMIGEPLRLDAMPEAFSAWWE
ncbi:MBL fold metallo-hydrolase [Breoghania sp.]|uniref:MBL fold metallo-hydrolase n=1 Tax=Breoghania sp. TaxID=2065378 RepID=UPI002AA83B51|nr:MBL fold metallo-hydrolase [Breoghania sp.]